VKEKINKAIKTRFLVNIEKGNELPKEKRDRSQRVCKIVKEAL
jgi:hypothetical protein